MTDLEAAVAAWGDRDDVEPAVRIRDAHPLEVVLGQADEPAALPPRHGRGGSVVPAFLPALHLDEDPHLAVAADEVDLTVPELHVPRDDAQARALEQTRRRFFRRAPEEVPGVAHASNRDRAGGR